MSGMIAVQSCLHRVHNGVVREALGVNGQVPDPCRVLHARSKGWTGKVLVEGNVLRQGQENCSRKGRARYTGIEKY
jgi:hypothetical protein